MPLPTRDSFNGVEPPREVFAPWDRAQQETGRLAREDSPAPSVLRTSAFLRRDLAERITDWFTGTTSAPAYAIHASYSALERETAHLSQLIHRDRRDGGLGVRICHVHAENDPYQNAAELCAQLRRDRCMTLRTIACQAPHPLLGSKEGGPVDQLRVAHDVFGHAALGLGFDLQSEFGTWLQCRTLFSLEARPAAYCELVGAVTAYVVTGELPVLRADLPPAALVAACDVGRPFCPGRRGPS
jgi:hypothetical protein